MSRTVLIIEDEPDVAGLFKDVLTADGFEVQVAPDGETGLDVFAESGFDAVIVDVVLPRLQGFDLLARLRNLAGGADVPVIMVSGEARGDNYAERMEAKHDIAAYLQGPYDLDRLKAILRTETERANGGGSLAAALSREVSASEAPIDEPPPLSVPTSGDLATVPFARILGGIYSERLTGALMLRKSSVKKLVYFNEGLPIFVKSNVLHECLGRVMVAERLISQDECDRSLARKHNEPHKRQGDLLVEMGCISTHNLEFGLELQMQAKLYDIFSWLEGRYQFNPNVKFEGEQVQLSMSPSLLVYEGASRAMSTERIRRDLAFAENWMLVPSHEPSFRYQALQLDPRADRFLDHIDGSRTAEQLIDGGDLEAADAALVLYALVCTSLVRVAFGHASPVKIPRIEPAVIPVPDAATAAISTDEEETVARAFGGPRGLHIPRRQAEPTVVTTDLQGGESVQLDGSRNALTEQEAEVFVLQDDLLGTMDDVEWENEIDAALDRSWASSIDPDAVRPSADLQPGDDNIDVVIEAPVIHGQGDGDETLTEDIALGPIARVGEDLRLPTAEPLPADIVLQAPLLLSAEPSPVENAEDSVVFDIPELADWLAGAEPLPEELVLEAPVPDVDETVAEFSPPFEDEAALLGTGSPSESVVFEASVPDVFAEVFDAMEPLPEDVILQAPVLEYSTVGPVARSTAGSASSTSASISRLGPDDEPLFEQEAASPDEVLVAIFPEATHSESAVAPVADEAANAQVWADDVEVVFEAESEFQPQPDSSVRIEEVHIGAPVEMAADAPTPELTADVSAAPEALVPAEVEAEVQQVARAAEEIPIAEVAVAFERAILNAEANGEEVADPVPGLAAADPDTGLAYDGLDPSAPEPAVEGSDDIQSEDGSIPLRDQRGPVPFGDQRGPVPFGEQRGPIPFRDQRGPVPFGDQRVAANVSAPSVIDEGTFADQDPAGIPEDHPSPAGISVDPLESELAGALSPADLVGWRDVDSELRLEQDAQWLRGGFDSSTDVEVPASLVPSPLLAQPSPERDRIEQELADRLEGLASMTHYDVLEVPVDAEDGEIREARARLESQFHPDRWTPDQLSARARRLTEQATLLVRRAADQLLSTAERLRYDRAIGVMERPPQADPFEAEQAFQAGQAALARDESSDAERQFRRAVERSPSEGEYIAALAETLASREAWEEASHLLERASDLSPHSRAVLLAQARLLRRQSNDEGAIDWYRRVLKLDPDCREAREFLAAQDRLFVRRTGLLARFTKA